MLTFFVFVFANAIICFFAIFVFATLYVVCLKSVILKYSNCFSYFLDLNYRGLKLNFIRLVQLLIDGDVDSNPGPTQNDCKSPRGRPKKIKVFKGTPKKFDLSESSNVDVASLQRYKMFSSIQYNLSA